jgi:hypothetical protein
MIHIRRILPLAAAALLGACNGLLSGSEPVDVVYEADRREYTRQDEIVTTLINTSDATVGYNLCDATLELRTSTGWKSVDRSTLRVCTQPLYILQPGESAIFREPASAIPASGTYRLRTRVETPVPGDAQYVTTDPFSVQQ